MSESSFPVAVRPAAASDLDFIVAGNEALAFETEHLRLERSVLRAGVQALLEERVPGAYWIAERGGIAVGQTLITFEWSDWRNRMIWWIQSVYVIPSARRRGVFRSIYAHMRNEALAAGAGGLRLYVEVANERAQGVYAAMGMNGDHYRVYEDMF